MLQESSARLGIAKARAGVRCVQGAVRQLARWTYSAQSYSLLPPTSLAWGVTAHCVLTNMLTAPRPLLSPRVRRPMKSQVDCPR